MGEALIVRIELDAGADADAEEIDEGARALNDELTALDVEAVDRAPGPSRRRSRFDTYFTLGATGAVSAFALGAPGLDSEDYAR